MQRLSVLPAFCTAVFGVAFGLLTACGPKDIGTGTSSEAERPPQGISTADQLRYPVYGSNGIQQRLYLQNQPDIMATMQQWRMENFVRMHGRTPVKPEDPLYRAAPRQPSPFRQ